MNYKSTFHSIGFLFLSGLAFSQTVIKEQDYTLTYNGNNIEVSFNSNSTLQASESKSSAAIPVTVAEAKSNTYLLTNLTPSENVKLDYVLSDGTVATAKTAYIAAPSLSSGVINVYFNHPVNTSLAQYQPAVSLMDKMDEKLIEYINNCRQTLDIAIYNSDSPGATSGIAGAINAAYARGVQVRIIYDGSTSSNMISYINPAIPRVASPTGKDYGIMHNKFVTFDANSSDPNIPWVWTGSTNWTVAQIDGPDKNNAIAIQDQTLAQAYKAEFDEMWGSSGMVPDKNNSKFGPFKTDNTPHSFVIGGKVVQCFFSPTDGVTTQIMNTLNSADSDIEMATMLITRDDIRDVLIAKHANGLAVEQGVFDTQNPTGNDIPALKNSLGVDKVVQDKTKGVMHHKFVIVDNFNANSDPMVLTGSHNWSTSAETRNDENTLIVHDKIVADQYYQAYAYLFKQAGGVLNTVDLSTPSNDLTLYPNPTDSIVYMKFNGNAYSKSGSISVYSVVGNKIFEKNYPNLQYATVDLSDYPKGLYFVTIKTDDKIYQSKVVVK